MLSQEPAPLSVGLSELQAFLRIETGEEEALLAGFLRVASDACETFLNQALVERQFEVEVRALAGWQLVPVQPIRSITSIRRAGSGELVDPTLYRFDIDHDGRGHVSGLPAGETLAISGTAGMARDANGVPEPIRQGILRLAAHLFTHRDGSADDLPRSVTALWRPYRRAGLCR